MSVSPVAALAFHGSSFKSDAGSLWAFSMNDCEGQGGKLWQISRQGKGKGERERAFEWQHLQCLLAAVEKEEREKGRIRGTGITDLAAVAPVQCRPLQ